jgi:arylformamidase
MVLADQVCRAVAWVYKNTARFDGDPNRLYIGGQSSGGHLVAVGAGLAGSGEPTAPQSRRGL